MAGETARVFAHLDAPLAPLYRRLLGVFIGAAFGDWMRPALAELVDRPRPHDTLMAWRRMSQEVSLLIDHGPSDCL